MLRLLEEVEGGVFEGGKQTFIIMHLCSVSTLLSQSALRQPLDFGSGEI